MPCPISDSRGIIIAEQRDGRNRHDDRGNVQNDVRCALVLRNRDPDRNAGKDRERHCDPDDRDMLDRALTDRRQVVHDKRSVSIPLPDHEERRPERE